MATAIHPDVEARLRDRAAAAGLTLDAYLERLMQEEDAGITHTEALLEEAAASGGHMELDDAEWDRIERDALAEVRAKSGPRP